MPRRRILTDRQRSALLDLPTDEATLLKVYTLADDDLEHIQQRRRSHNKLGFALQLCALRHPGRVLAPGEVIPKEVTEFIGAQLGLEADDLLDYAAREETRHEHMASLRRLYGYRTFSGRRARDLKTWLAGQAEEARSNEHLARQFVLECQRTNTILPAITTIERLCADALVAAERRIETRIADRLDGAARQNLAALLDEMVDDRLTRFVWLRQFEPGDNSAKANRLLDRLEFMQGIDLPNGLLDDVPAHRITRLRRQGERYFADGLRELPDSRRLAILAVCTMEWKAMLADTVVETHDRIVGKTYRAAQRLCETRIADEKTAVRQTLQSFAEIGGALIAAQHDGTVLDDVITERSGWDGFRELVAMASKLTDTMADDPLNHVVQGYNRFRRYAPRMLRLLDIQAAPVAQPLLTAVQILRGSSTTARPVNFLRPRSKWQRLLNSRPDDARLWETAVLFHLRDAFRSGDIWLKQSQRYADLKQALVPAHVVANTARLAVPLQAEDWLADRRACMAEGLKRLGQTARTGTIPTTLRCRCRIRTPFS